MENEGAFDMEAFEKRLKNLKDTQDGIQGLSAWCLLNHVHHKKIVQAWLQVLKQVKVEHRLVLFYLANDVIQHSKRKNYDFVESWGTALQRATTTVRDDKVKHKVMRIFKIWGDRQVYTDEFLADLNGLLSASLPKPKPKDDPDDFQIQTVVNSIRQCGKLQTETDRTLKTVNKLQTPKLPGTFKDRSHCKEVTKQIDEDVRKHEKHLHSLKAEIKARTVLMEALKQADEFYQTQRGEVKVVANAYKNFGNRIKNLKKKLDELTSQLPSPIPSPPANAPSPSPDDVFELPMQQFAGFSSNGFVSYMEGGHLPFDPMDFNRKTPSPHVNSIQVINSNTPDGLNNPNNNLNDFFKTLLPPDQYDPAASINFNDYSMSSNTSFGGVPPPVPAYAPITMSNYGMSGGNAPGFVRNNYTGQAVPPPPLPPLEGPSQNFNNWEPNWNAQDRHSMPGNPLLETPHSPPQYERKSANTAAPIEYVDMENSLEQAGSDVDHRSLTDILQSRVADIDHRNLISLTGSPGDSSNKHKKEPGDVDLRQTLLNLQKPPPPPSTNDKKDGDVDFRVPPPPLANIFPAGFNPLELPPILQDTSIGDIAKLLEGTSGHEKMEPPRKKQKGENGDDHFGSDDMEMSDEEDYQGSGYQQSSDNNNGNAPPGFDTDQDPNQDNNDDLNNGNSEWNQSSGGYNLIGQRLMQLANQDPNNGGGGGAPSSNFIRPLMQMPSGRPPPPPPGFFNQSPGGPAGPNQFPGSPMFRPRGGRGNRGGSPFFRGGPSPRGFNNYRGNNFRGGHRGRW